MNPRERKAALDSAEWRVTLGALAGAGLALLRLFSVLAVLSAPDRDWRLLSLTVIELFACAYLATQVQARRAWAAITLLAVWALGLANAWFAAGTVLPPFALLSLLIGAGLVLGVTGVYDLRELRTAEQGGSPAV